MALCCGLLYAVFVAGCMAAFLVFVRQKLTLFSDALCKLLDDMMSADQAPPQYTEEENLFYKSSTDFPGSMKCCGKAKAALQRNGPTCRN